MGLLAAVLFGHSLLSSVQDTAVDALAIGVTPEGERGRANAFMRAGFLVGCGGGTAGFAHLIRDAGFPAAAAAHSGLLLLFAGLLVAVRERPGDALLSLGRRPVPGAGGAAGRPTVRAVLAAMWGGLLAARSLRLAGPVLVAYAAASLFFSAQAVHLIQRQGWADTDLATFAGLAGTLAALGVTAAGGGLADRVGVGRLLRWSVAGFAAFLLLFGLAGPHWAAPGVGTLGLAVGAVVDPLLSVAALPALMGVCRRGAEGSQFTAYMALVNQAGVFGGFLAGQLLEVTTAPAIGVGCGLAVLLAAVALRPPRTIPA